MLCRATQDRRVTVKSSNKKWSTGEGNGKPLQYSCLENPMKSMKRQNDRTPKEELPRSVGAQYATGDQWRNNSRKNEGMEPKQKQYPVVDATGDRSKVRCCKEYWSGLPFPTPGDLPNPRIELMSPALAGRFFTTVPILEPLVNTSVFMYSIYYID